MKKGDKVVLISRSVIYRKLIYHNTYIVENDTKNTIKLENIPFRYHKSKFITLKEFRTIKLKKICLESEKK